MLESNYYTDEKKAKPEKSRMRPRRTNKRKHDPIPILLISQRVHKDEPEILIRRDHKVGESKMYCKTGNGTRVTSAKSKSNRERRNHDGSWIAKVYRKHGKNEEINFGSEKVNLRMIHMINVGKVERQCVSLIS